MPTLMKGHTWKAHKHKMTYPAIVEHKVDEVRCHVQVGHSGCLALFDSYAGKPLANMQPFVQGFIELAGATGHHSFDCGFEVNGNFNDSYRWVRSTKGLPEDLQYAVPRFYLFDLPDLSTPFLQRMAQREFVLSAAKACGIPMRLPRSLTVASAESAEASFALARHDGVEGVMVKSLTHVYEAGKRSYGWLKMKPEDDADGVITRIHEAISEDGTPLGRAGSVTIKVEDGSEASPHGIPHELGRDMWENKYKYIGQWAEFKYMERDRQGGYRHPVWGRLREAKA